MVHGLLECGGRIGDFVRRHRLRRALVPDRPGNIIGNPILPVIKICANPRTVKEMPEHVDVDTSGLLRREINMGDAGDKLLDCMLRTANGRLTAAEALGHREFSMTKLYRSA